MNSFLGALGILAALFITRVVGADWPMARHDAQRTGAANGTSNIQTPTAYWRYPMGVSLSRESVLPFTRPDGVAHIALLSSGQTTLYRRNNATPLWTSDTLPVSTLGRVTDLNDDGNAELLAFGRNEVFLLDATTGAVLWQLPTQLIGVVSTVRVGDFTGDGIDDLMVLECKCCELKSGRNGFVYTFPNLVGTPELYWELPRVECSNGRSTVLLDHDGDGARDLAVVNGGSYHVYDLRSNLRAK